MNRQSDLHVTEQAAAEIVGILNVERMQNLVEKIHTQDEAFRIALEEINRVREFIGTPEHILGRLDTKHGEVAEQMEVGIRRAFDALNQRTFSAAIEDFPRMGPVDYQIDGTDVQSKYINGAKKTLDHIRDHLERYPWFGDNDGFYHVAKDQYAQIEMAYRGITPEGLSDASAQKLRDKIQEAIDKTGRPFDEIIRPGSYKYSEVQLGNAPKAVDRDEQNIRRTQNETRNRIEEQHQPSFAEAVEGAAIAGVVAAGLSLGYALYKKQKAGKSVFDLNADDWKEMGIDSAKAGGSGSVTALAIYGLTNFTEMPAPLAGAIASTARGIYIQIRLYQTGKLTEGQLIDNSMALGGEAGIVALCSVAGQAVIPMPILGGVIGSIVGKFISKIATDFLGKSGEALANAIKHRTDAALEKLDSKYQLLVTQFTADFDALGSLIEKAFDPEFNSHVVELSIEIAERTGVPNEQILRSRDDLDRFMTT